MFTSQASRRSSYGFRVGANRIYVVAMVSLASCGSSATSGRTVDLSPTTNSPVDTPTTDTYESASRSNEIPILPTYAYYDLEGLFSGLSLTWSGDCLLGSLESTDEQFVVLVPEGTVSSENNSVLLPSGATVTFGSLIEATGGFVQTDAVPADVKVNYGSCDVSGFDRMLLLGNASAT